MTKKKPLTARGAIFVIHGMIATLDRIRKDIFLGIVINKTLSLAKYHLRKLIKELGDM